MSLNRIYTRKSFQCYEEHNFSLKVSFDLAEYTAEVDGVGTLRWDLVKHSLEQFI